MCIDGAGYTLTPPAISSLLQKITSFGDGDSGERGGEIVHEL